MGKFAKHLSENVGNMSGKCSEYDQKISENNSTIIRNNPKKSATTRNNKKQPEAPRNNQKQRATTRNNQKKKQKQTETIRNNQGQSEKFHKLPTFQIPQGCQPLKLAILPPVV